MADVTGLLRRCHSDPAARNELFGLVYSHLHRIASAKVMKWDHPPLQATELVNAAYLKLFGDGGAAMHRDWQARGLFYAFTATVMANLLKGLHRDATAKKRGGGAAGQPLDEETAAVPSVSDEVVLTLDLMDELRAEKGITGRIAQLHYGAGRPFDEIVQILRADDPPTLLGPAEVEKHWKLARAWIKARLTRPSHEG
ncbi:MAG: hypothetical protein K2W96_15620 [Gemmataceae bacterium]|nr:hypothetical protein [Gemmataceae bacterium]